MPALIAIPARINAAPAIDAAVFEAGVPVFGMCYGFQLMAQGMGGQVARAGRRLRPFR